MMRICIPVTGKEGLEATIEQDFTAAEHLLVVNIQSGEHRTFSREADEQAGAPEEPIAVDAVLCAGMHVQLLGAFAAQSIQVFATRAATVAEALLALRHGDVEELKAKGCCGGAHHAHQEEEAHECCGGGGCGGHSHDEDEHAHAAEQGCGGAGCACHG